MPTNARFCYTLESQATSPLRALGLEPPPGEFTDASRSAAGRLVCFDDDDDAPAMGGYQGR